MSKLVQLVGVVFSIALISCNTDNENKHADSGSDEPTAHDMHAEHTMNGHQHTVGYADSVNNGLIKEDTLKGSPHCTAMRTIGGTHVHIEYNSPGTKGRTIWGGLVAWDKVWVAGAHDATAIKFYKDVVINAKTIKAGTYALFAIPGKGKWTWILNTNFDQHLTDEYNQKEDVLRVEAVASKNPPTPRLTYEVEGTGDKTGTINLLWDSLKVSLPFETL